MQEEAILTLPTPTGVARNKGLLYSRGTLFISKSLT